MFSPSMDVETTSRLPKMAQFGFGITRLMNLSCLAGSVPAFISHCVGPQPVELLPEQVRSVRIDPAFQKSVGRICRKMAGSRSRPNGNNKTTITLFLGRGFE